MLTTNLRTAIPGLGTALVAFGIYCVGEAVYKKFNTPSDSHSQHQKAIYADDDCKPDLLVFVRFKDEVLNRLILGVFP